MYMQMRFGKYGLNLFNCVCFSNKAIMQLQTRWVCVLFEIASLCSLYIFIV